MISQLHSTTNGAAYVLGMWNGRQVAWNDCPNTLLTVHQKNEALALIFPYCLIWTSNKGTEVERDEYLLFESYAAAKGYMHDMGVDHLKPNEDPHGTEIVIGRTKAVRHCEVHPIHTANHWSTAILCDQPIDWFNGNREVIGASDC